MSKGKRGFCLDCNISVWKKGARCMSCAQKIAQNTPERLDIASNILKDRWITMPDKLKSCRTKEWNEKVSVNNYKRWKTIYNPDAPIRRDGKEKAWRKKVRELFTCCAYCESIESLVAHHILSVSKHPELRLNINNGIMLCESCHKYEHKINGVI